MYSRTTFALFSIIVCTFAFLDVKASTTTEIMPTEGHAAASISTENLPTDTSPLLVGQTTLSPVLNSSASSTMNESTTVVPSTKLSLVTTLASMKSSPAVSSTTIASTTVNTTATEHENSTVIASTTFQSSFASSETEQVSTTVNKGNNTSTVLSTQETSTFQGNATSTSPMEMNTTTVADKIGNSMRLSETILTSIFSTILVVVLLTILAFCFNKYRKRRSQYSHHPLHENMYESEGYSPPDDTLVISGGLYDAPRIYNPNMTVLEEDDSQHDYVSFSNRPGQFRLEFLPGDKDDPAYNGSLRRNV